MSGEITGKIVESQLLGETLKLLPRTESYLSYRAAMDQARSLQPWPNPSEPEPRFAYDLHYLVAEKLNLEDLSDLEFYTAVGSELDHFHGVDAWFELRTKSGKKIRVTFDVTLNPQKGEQYKADVIIFIPEEALDREENPQAYNELLKDASSEIANQFNYLLGR